MEHKLDSDKLNRWLTLGANIGVIAGILFLAYEIRQNSESLEAQSRYAHSMLRSDFFYSLGTEPVVTAILLKAQEDQELTAEDQFRLRNFYMYMFTNWQWEWVEHELGRFEAPLAVWSELLAEDTENPLQIYPGIRETWEINKTGFTPEFVRFMDNEIIN